MMQNQLDETTTQILNLLNKTLSSEELIKQFGSILNTLIPFDRFSLGLSQLRFWYYLQNGSLTTEQNFNLFHNKASASSWVFINQKPHLRKDILNDQQFDFDQTLQKEQMRSDMILPISINEIPVGTFNLTHKESNFYNDLYFDLAQKLIPTIALCAKQILNYQDNHAIGLITQELQHANNVDAILTHIIEHLHLEFDRIRVYLYDAKANILHGRLQINEKGITDLSHRSYTFDKDPYTQQTFQSELPKIYHANTPEHITWLKSSRVDNIHTATGNKEWAEIGLRIFHDEQETIIGKISLDNNKTQIPLHQNHLNQKMVFIRQAALALYQAGLYQNLADQVEQRTQQLSATNQILEEKDKLLTALQEVSHRSFSYLDQDQILDSFAEQIIQAGIFRSLMIALVDNDLKTVEVVRAFQRENYKTPQNPGKISNYSDTCGIIYAFDDDNITPTTARTGELQMIVSPLDNRLDNRFEVKENWNDKIAYFIPIKREDKVVAVLATGTKRKDKKLFLNHLKTMEPLFDQLGIALEHAVLYRKARHSETRLAELIDFQNQMLDTPNVWICAFDNDKKINFWNRAAESISGYPSQEVLGLTDIWEKLHPDPIQFKHYAQVATELFQTKGRIENIESTIYSKDGTLKDIAWYANTLTNKTGQQLGFLVIGLDISLRKKLETEVVRLERLKALGEMAAGISHNLNNMLTGILLPAAMLKSSPLPDLVRENVEDIFVSAKRARDLVVQLNQSVRNDATDPPEPVDVNQVITEAIRATRARWKDESEAQGISIAIHVQLLATKQAMASTSGLHDVLVNLIFNAIDAMPQGGEIDIRSVLKQNQIYIYVKDNGVGMSDETKLKVFEPFFTTKTDVGTGLGLSTAYNQIQRWGGNLTVESKLGKGSTFTIDIPIWKGASVPIPKVTPPTLPALHILVVEDDVYVGRAIDKYLSPTHKVKLVDTANKALEAIAKHTFDLALIDLGLPDIPGDKLGQSIKTKYPDLPLILMTGWSLSQSDPRKKPFQAYLQKPISNLQMLLEAISRVLKNSAE